MSEWIRCPKCGVIMSGYTGYHQCSFCGYKLPVPTVTLSTGTSYEQFRLIRCKDCIWFDTEESYDDVYHCELHNTDTIESNYCSWAERKEECQE